MADVFIIDRNRAGLKTIFARHSDSEEHLSYSEALKCATALRIYPVIPTQDLLSSLELKRLFYKAADHFTTEDQRVQLGYLQFERLLKMISSHCFHGELTETQRLQLLLMHIQTLAYTHYKVALQTEQKSGNFETKTLRKNVSLEGLPSTHRKSLGKSTPRGLLVKSGTTDSLATERPFKSHSLHQNMQQLYHIITPKASKSHVKATFTAKRRKVDLAFDHFSPRAPLRQRVGSESTRQHSETLSQYLSFDKKHSETSIKLMSPLPTHESFLGRDSGLLHKIKRAVDNLEKKTDLAMKRTQLQGKWKRTLSDLGNIFRECQEKVRNHAENEATAGIFKVEIDE